MGISFQSNTDYHPDIQNIGCEYLLVVAMACDVANHSISTNSINAVWHLLKSEGLADQYQGLHKPRSYRRALALLFMTLRDPGFYGDQVGQIVNGK